MRRFRRHLFGVAIGSASLALYYFFPGPYGLAPVGGGIVVFGLYILFEILGNIQPEVPKTLDADQSSEKGKRS